MNGNTTKIIAIAVVLIVVAATAGFFLLKGDDGSDNSKIESQLLVYGNANGDETVDKEDLAIISDIIAGKKTLNNHPLADANNDGKVDAQDIAVVEKLIKREATVIYVSCLDPNGNQTAVKCNYPVTNVVPLGTNMIGPFLNIGGLNHTAGYFYCGYQNAEKALINSNAIDLKGSSRDITDASWQNFIELDGKLQSKGGIGAVFVDQSMNALNNYRNDLNTAGIPEIRYAVANASEEMSAALTMGFIMGQDSESKSLKYAQMGWNVISEINKKINKIADKDKKNYICLTMGVYVCQNGSTFNQAPMFAGGMPYYETNAEFAEKYKGSSSVKMSGPEALSNYDDANVIISNRGSDYGIEDKNAEIVKTWDKYKKNFEGLDNYKSMVYLNNILPGGVKIAYIATVLYPDLFSVSWADNILKGYMSEFVTFEDQSLDGILTVYTYEDYTKAEA